MTPWLRRPLTLLVPAALTCALAAGSLPAVAADAPDPLNTAPLSQPARGLIVKLADDADGAVADLVDDVAAELPSDIGVAETTSGPADLGLLELSEEVESEDLDAAIEVLESDPQVEWVVPNGVRLPSATASDSYFRDGRLWNLNGAWGVEADKAWDITTGSPNVRVAVVDTGLVANHPDLEGQSVAGRDFVDDEYDCANLACSRIRYRNSFTSANDGNSWDANPADPGDWRDYAGQCAGMAQGRSTWHGTHVAGTIAAKRDNGGVVGVAPTVKVQPVRVLGRCGGTDWDIAMGVLWASGVNVTGYDGRRHGAVPVNRTPSKVINLSLGGWVPRPADVRELCKFYGQIASVARTRGSTIVAAAGNNGRNHAQNVPSSCPGYIAVAATNQQGLRASFSNYGAGIDVAAPGVAIYSTANSGATGPQTNSYPAYRGTSMAAPSVSAAAAMAYSAGITHPDVVERVLKATARRAAGCSVAQCGAGVVSAHRVLTAKAPTSAPRLTGTPRPGGTLRATPGAWRNGATVKLTWLRAGRAVAAGPAYRVTKADIGKVVTVRATATNGSPGIFHQSSVAVKVKPRLAFGLPSKLKKSTRAKMTVKVKAPYVRPTGTIKVYDGKKRIAVKKLKAKNKGKVVIKLPKITRKGKHRIRVVYSGSGKVSAAKRSKVVRVR
ncbi:S8 family serine peptidase [Aeromicrobium sp. 636]|uniref:S8 family serine peptidase n=1 Tax=Aeromicrobium senzhongii TaxID=2663859 RepID=A0A8I0K1E7_9ACTN|nr:MULTISPECIES: S8 family serine peptidase [Aeromicrobium]MBC9227436.1 S8 family serine peptidase [Aeromicrobium senzhongii]MCQ3999533.1 S8 family serine peptidase [Aeromicrobium sp. 636]